MSELSTVSDTLYVPLLGRIYASKHHPSILFDEMALKIAPQLPENVREMPGTNEYTQLASAVRSRNMDLYIQAFLSAYPNGAVINAGCGLEGIYERNDNGEALWFEVDLPEVLELRRKYFPENKRDRYLAYSLFDYTWIEEAKSMINGPVLVIASGLFYYFTEDQVIDFIEHLAEFEDVQLVFDAVSSLGMRGTRHYMKKMKKQDAEMFFSYDSAEAIKSRLHSPISVVEERKFYSLINLRSKMGFPTKMKMFFSDALNMVKMVHLQIG